MSPWLGLAAIVLVVDQMSKYAAEAYLSLHVPVAILPGLNFTLTYNPGAAFSFLSDAGGWQRWLFSSIAFAASLAIVVWLHRLPKRTDSRRAHWHWCSVVLLVISGIALRRRGMVVDFIDVYAGKWHWPAFNVADSAIVLGVIIMLITVFVTPEGERTSSD